MTRRRARRNWTPAEIRLVMNWWRKLRWSYFKIGSRLGRNHSSVGALVRRENLREEQRLRELEATE